jgi:hypothetical protein
MTEYTSGGSYHCAGCGATMISPGYSGYCSVCHYNRNIWYKQDTKIGWVCPVCGRGISPFITKCPCKGCDNLDDGGGTR